MNAIHDTKNKKSFSNKNRPIGKPARAFMLLTVCFIVLLVMTNLISGKYFSVAGLPFPSGAIIYPLTFLILDIITEIYGVKKSRFVVWLGFFASILMVLIVQISNMLPVHKDSPVSQAMFQSVFGFTPGIVLGSMVAYLTAQFVDIHLFGLFRKLTNDKHLWLRNNGSTIISQLVDTVLVGSIAFIIWPMFAPNEFVRAITWTLLYEITINEYVFKILFTLSNTPLMYAGKYMVKRYING